MFRNHQCSVFRVLSTALNVNSIKQQSSSQNVHKLFMLVRKLLFLSQLTTKNSLLQTLHGGKMNRKKRWFCKRFSCPKLVLSRLLILCESLNSLNFRVTLISGFFFLYREIRENNVSRKFLVIRYSEVNLHLIAPSLAA